MPERIANVLCILAILAEYGRHLFDTIENRACRSGFSTIAQFFGTARISVILAHLSRGIMRAAALERMLRERARRGRDLVVLTRRDDTVRAPKPPAPPPTASAAAEPSDAAPQPQPAARCSERRAGAEEPLTPDNLPSMRQIEAEVRRSPIGRTLVAICLDFGLAPLLCTAAFGNDLFSLFRWYGGSFGKYFDAMRKREQRFERQELDRNPNLGWPEQARDKVKQVLGFFAGERPFDPFAITSRPASSPAPGMAVAAAATGPP